MNVFQSIYDNNEWSTQLEPNLNSQLILLFGNRDIIADQQIRQQIHQNYPNANLVGCTTSGEIQGAALYNDTLCLTAIEFKSTTVKVYSQSVSESDSTLQLGQDLAKKLQPEGLRHVFLISDGQLVNGTELIDGITPHLPEDVLVTGGLAGDGSRFEETQVWHDDRVESGLVVVVGLYGESLQIGHGNLGGWREFGPERQITKSKDNILYELDGKPALELYKQFLGEHADNLPASALLFPLAMTQESDSETVVRTILNIDEDNQSMIFAGSMPEGATCQLMRANYADLVDGAEGAVTKSIQTMPQSGPELAILISCVGRRLVLNQRTEEELEIIQEMLPDNCKMTGFYSYGEISPIVPFGRCGLHNQTMTITLFSEN
ncbi:FIST signal transduction protein [Glaciecola sp. MF2-115]|uniref:FIST signal transduction protein n=1 Tax=Glaciecola sp. MF2-115 TaxID=3384827 RepID=UPI0039A240A1